VTVEDIATDADRIRRWRAPSAWATAIRPRSLLVAVSPVLVGASLGYRRTGSVDPETALLVLAAALLMQVATNLQNDVGYAVRNADRGETRVGLPRATTSGALSVFEVRVALAIVASVALAVGLALAAYRGWPVLAIGAASLAAALAYMGGPRPIAYTPFGELTVFVFFGLVGVTGTCWMLTGGFDVATLLCAAAIGALAAAALAINNHRDAAHDRLVGRRTFAVVFGPIASRRLFAALLLGAFALLPVIALQSDAPALLLPMLRLPAALTLRRGFVHAESAAALTDALLRTFRLAIEFALLLAVGAAVG